MGQGYSLILNVLYTTVVSPRNSLIVSPLNMVFNPKNDVTFICDALGGPNNTFQWQMDGDIIGNDSVLEVMDIDASSGGVYTCTQLEVTLPPPHSM